MITTCRGGVQGSYLFKVVFDITMWLILHEEAVSDEAPKRRTTFQSGNTMAAKRSKTADESTRVVDI